MDIQIQTSMWRLLCLIPRRAEFLLVLLGLILGGCGGVHSLPGEATRGYILISMDTLRADRLGCYGNQTEISPFLDALAQRSVLFENAYVQLPGTLPSHMSIFTGLYPSEHNVYPPTGVLSPEIKTIPEQFQANGFRTAGFTEGGYVHGGYGFSRGFDEFSHESNQVDRDIETTLDRGLSFLRKIEERDKFFLFLHSYAVHDPYFPIAPYREMFWKDEVPADAVSPTGPELSDLNRAETAISGEALAYYKALYNAQIRYVDDQLRRFFDEIEELGLKDEVTIIFTSDHGEEFLEHGKLLHTQIFRETLHVPLIVYRPGLSPRRVRRVVESVDIAPTLYDFAGVDFRGPMTGVSLRDLLEGRNPQGFLDAYAENHDSTERSLVRLAQDGVYQFLLKSMHSRPGSWIQEEVSFDSFGDKLELSMMSYHHPRTLEIHADGELVKTVQLSPELKSYVVELISGKQRQRITLRGLSCDSPVSLGINEDKRCLSFMVAEPALEQYQLYNMDSDPEESIDLSEQLADLTKAFKREVDHYKKEPLVEGENKVLDPELRARLRALGYLR